MSTSPDQQEARLAPRTRTILSTGVIVVILIAIIGLLPVPYVVLRPGPTFNAVGEVDGTQLITVSGAKTYSSKGELNITTVSEAGGPYSRVSLVEALWSWLEPSTAVLPSKLLYPQPVTGDQIRSENTADFIESQYKASTAAFRYLGVPVRPIVIVASVVIGGPSDGRLEPGDTVVSVNGKRPTDANNAVKLVRTTKPGDKLVFVVQRQGKTRVETVIVGKNPQDPRKPYLGISVGNSFTSDKVTVTYGLSDVGGPSAGLMFSLGVVNTLSRPDLTGGRNIAGTGTIDYDGTVGPIGGIQQKMAGARRDGATYFLTPTRNCFDAVPAAPKGLTLVRVDTLDGAVAELERIKAGKPTTTC